MNTPNPNHYWNSMQSEELSPELLLLSRIFQLSFLNHFNLSQSSFEIHSQLISKVEHSINSFLVSTRILQSHHSHA